MRLKHNNEILGDRPILWPVPMAFGHQSTLNIVPKSKSTWSSFLWAAHNIRSIRYYYSSVFQPHQFVLRDCFDLRWWSKAAGLLNKTLYSVLIIRGHTDHLTLSVMQTYLLICDWQWMRSVYALALPVSILCKHLNLLHALCTLYLFVLSLVSKILLIISIIYFLVLKYLKNMK